LACNVGGLLRQVGGVLALRADVFLLGLAQRVLLAGLVRFVRVLGQHVQRILGRGDVSVRFDDVLLSLLDVGGGDEVLGEQGARLGEVLLGVLERQLRQLQVTLGLGNLLGIGPRFVSL
jgi:hypothetical protein